MAVGGSSDKRRRQDGHERAERGCLTGIARAPKEIPWSIKVIILQLGKLDVASPSGKLMLQMLAAVAEMERDLLVELTQSGLARAKSEGKVLGRPVKTIPSQQAEIMSLRKSGATISSSSRIYAVSRATIMRVTGEVLVSK